VGSLAPRNGAINHFEDCNEKWDFKTRAHAKTGNKPLALSTLYKLFGNVFYYGLLARKEGVFQGKHEPMITEDEYWKAQEILGRKEDKTQKAPVCFHRPDAMRGVRLHDYAETKVNRYGSITPITAVRERRRIPIVVRNRSTLRTWKRR